MSDTPEDLLGFAPPGAGEFDAPPSESLPAKNKTPFNSQNWNIEKFIDPKNLIRWMNKTREVPLEAIDSCIVNESYPAMTWLFRKSAMDGDLKATKAIEAWLTWAKPIINKPPTPREIPRSEGSVAFLPRETAPPDGELEDE